MLVKYTMGDGSSEYERFYNEKASEVICSTNPEYKEIIRDMLIDYIRNGCFECSLIIDDIRTINSSIAEQIAELAIQEGLATHHWDENNDYTELVINVSDDILDTLFFGEDILIAIQQMVYEAAKEYNIPLIMNKGMFFEFPEMLQMYSSKGSYIEDIPDNEDVVIYTNHAQLVMFDEFMDNCPSFFGRNNILLYDEIELKGNKMNLLEE